VPRHDPRRATRRLRTIALLLFLVGAGAAALTYWLETRHAEPSIEELLPGSRAAAARQTGMLYGHGVQSLWEIYLDLKEPAGQAGLILLGAGVGCAIYLRLAWLQERDV
jgi:hypothetical protein